jgi:hypothetical protein
VVSWDQQVEVLKDVIETLDLEGGQEIILGNM